MPDIRLIDANAIVEKLQRYYESLSPDVYSELIRRDEVSSCIAEMINATTIDAQPVKHGMWRKRMSTSDSVKCCLCGYASIQESSYCGGCGAFMRGDADD